MIFFDAASNGFNLAGNVSPSPDRGCFVNDKCLGLCFTRCSPGGEFVMPDDRVPGVFVEELLSLPPSVAEVDTALPAFVGYTEKACLNTPGDLHLVPQRIRSFAEFEACYGSGFPYAVRRVDIDQAGNFVGARIEARFYLMDAVRLYYANGGADCYVVSVGGFPRSGKAGIKALAKGLKVLAGVDGPRVLLVPDAVMLGESHLGAVQQAALAQCDLRRDRFAILDLGCGDPLGVSLRGAIGLDSLSWGAAYTPWLQLHPGLPARYAQLPGRLYRGGRLVRWSALTEDPDVHALLARLDALLSGDALPGGDAEIAQAEAALLACFPLYRAVIEGIRNKTFLCPPSGAVAGIYARTDRERGVWKVPANTTVNGIAGLAVEFSRLELESLGSDPATGKSINPIRSLPGKGWQLWGARTLLGSDNEWRYVPVRRFCIMVESSLAQALTCFVFEPNNANTWARARVMVENYLLIKWREGALMGERPEYAFFVKCGLGQTMSAQDLRDGCLRVEIGLAILRPAEFVVLRLVQALLPE